MIFKVINKVSVITAIFSFVLVICVKHFNEQPIELFEIIIITLSFGMIPTCIALILCAIFPNLLSENINKISLQLAIGGLVLLFVYLKVIIDNLLISIN